MRKVFFISGIDTDSGKTIVTGLIAKFLLSENKKVITQKLVQSGCSGIAGDIIIHRKIMGIDLLPEDISKITCPFVFSHPSSPELAASLENKKIDIDIINKNTGRLSKNYDFVLIEGAGGLMVPVTKEKMIIDIISENNYELILVTNSKLGSINHTLLSIEVCKKYNILLKAVIYNNHPVADEFILNNSRQVIREYLKNIFPDTVFLDVPFVNLEKPPVISFESLAFDS